MPKFVIESPHTVEECDRALEETVEKNLIDKFVFGCKTGEHTGWAYVKADSKEKALENVPEFLRAKASVHEARKFTEEEIRAAH